MPQEVLTDTGTAWIEYIKLSILIPIKENKRHDPFQDFKPYGSYILDHLKCTAPRKDEEDAEDDPFLVMANKEPSFSAENFELVLSTLKIDQKGEQTCIHVLSF